MEGTRRRGRVCTFLCTPNRCHLAEVIPLARSAPGPETPLRSARSLSTRSRELRLLRTSAPWRQRGTTPARAQERGRGRRARARVRGARRAGGAARCSHDGRGCVRSGQSRGRLRPLHPGAAATHHPARRVLGKDALGRGARGTGATSPGRGGPAGATDPGRTLLPWPLPPEFLNPIAVTFQPVAALQLAARLARVRGDGARVQGRLLGGAD